MTHPTDPTGMADASSTADASGMANAPGTADAIETPEVAETAADRPHRSRSGPRLAAYTTLGLGGPAARFMTATTERELLDAVRGADREGEPLLVLGGGSNLVVADEGFPGTVVHVATRGVERSGPPAGEGHDEGRPGDRSAGPGGDRSAGPGGDRSAGPGGDRSAGPGGDRSAGPGGDPSAGPGGDPGPGDGSGERSGDGRVYLRARAGEDWDSFVTGCVDDGLAGVECLSGIPGSLGATPIQNVGAYGQEVSETVAAVRAYDRTAGAIVTLRPPDCRFTYRNSVFKGSDRYVVLDVTYALTRGTLSQPIRYAELARTLGVSIGERVPLRAAREAVLSLRRRKGMVLDPSDPDTRSAGSFFTNPILSDEQLAELDRRVAERLGPQVRAPRYPEAGGRTKTSAAWLIERAGFTKGHGRGPVRISTKHTLALTNPNGSASTADLLALAREVRDGVRAAFGVELVNEPTLLGVTL
jgi:UDP-N-acetylmuramate dehydrogenase